MKYFSDKFCNDDVIAQNVSVLVRSPPPVHTTCIKLTKDPELLRRLSEMLLFTHKPLDHWQ